MSSHYAMIFVIFWLLIEDRRLALEFFSLSRIDPVKVFTQNALLRIVINGY